MAETHGTELRYTGSGYGASVPFTTPDGTRYETSSGGTVMVDNPEHVEWLKTRGFMEQYTPVLMEYSGPSIARFDLSDLPDGETGNKVALSQPYTMGDAVQYRHFEAHPDDAKRIEAAGLAKPVEQHTQEEHQHGVGGETPSGAVVNPEVLGDTGGVISLAWLTDTGLSQEKAQAIVDAGFTSADAVRTASDEQLRGVDGIGPSSLDKLRTL